MQVVRPNIPRGVGESGLVPAPRTVVRPRHAVARQIRTLLEERGWVRRGGSYFGYYRTPSAAFPGRIVLRPGQPPTYYLVDPPASLFAGPHAPCFKAKGGGSYEVHFARRGPALDDGLLAVEGVLRDATAQR